MDSVRYQIIRSNRKTIGLEISRNGLVVRAPLRVTEAQINEFIQQHKDWITKH